jgi:CBS domain containing-hemolysin-like protein
MTANWLLLGLVVLLLLASAFFVAAEFSLIAARRTVIEPMAVNSARARSTLKAMENVSLMMACAQLGITLCGVLLGALGEPAVAALLEPVFHSLGVPEAWLHPVSLVVALTLVVSAHVALGEMVPKNIAIAGPEATALVLAPPLRAIAMAIGPIIRTLNRVANGVVRLTGREPKDEVTSAFTREEVAELVSESRREGLLDDEEHQRITSALDFDTTAVSSVMVPDAQVVSVRPEVSAAEIERICARTGFSRFPILGADGRFSGYIHIRDVVTIPAGLRDEPIPAKRIRALPTVGPDTDLRTALDRMRRIGAHLAEVAVPADPVPVDAALAGAVPADTAPVDATVGAAGAPAGSFDGGSTAGSGTTEGTHAGSTDGIAAPVRGVVMLEDVIEALIGEIRDATRRAPEPRTLPTAGG